MTPSAVYDQISLRYIGPPVPGVCSITPPEGVLMREVFTVECKNWTSSGDDPSGYPLNYGIRIQNPDGTKQMLAPPQPSNIFTDLPLPLGEPVTVLAVITDANGIPAEYPLEAFVRKPEDVCVEYLGRKKIIGEDMTLSIRRQDERILTSLFSVAKSLDSAATANQNACPLSVLPTALEGMVQDACKAANSSATLKERLQAAHAITALAGPVTRNATTASQEDLFRCYPEFDPCELPEDETEAMLDATVRAVAAAIGSDSFTPKSTTGLQTTESQTSSLAETLNTFIKNPHKRLADCYPCGQGLRNRNKDLISVTTGKICFSDVSDAFFLY
eukprot:tig00021012_g16981.t1